MGLKPSGSATIKTRWSLNNWALTLICFLFYFPFFFLIFLKLRNQLWNTKKVNWINTLFDWKIIEENREERRSFQKQKTYKIQLFRGKEVKIFLFLFLPPFMSEDFDHFQYWRDLEEKENGVLNFLYHDN